MDDLEMPVLCPIRNGDDFFFVNGQPIKISVSSAIPGMVVQNVELEVEQRRVGMSWLAFLVDRGLKQIDPERMMIRSPGGKIMTAPSEPIRNFLNQYKKRVQIYRIQIVKTNSRTRGKLNARRQELKRERLEEMSSPGRALPPPQAARRVGVIRRSGGELPGAAAGRKKVKFNFPGHSRYAEDDPNFGPPIIVGDVEENDVNLQDDGDNDDNASLCSQDSQDPGVDIKSGVVQRLQNAASDGDMLRIIEELQALKRKQRVLKVSRYIPHTMNLLNLMFEPQLLHQL